MKTMFHSPEGEILYNVAGVLQGRSNISALYAYHWHSLWTSNINRSNKKVPHFKKKQESNNDSNYDSNDDNRWLHR